MSVTRRILAWAGLGVLPLLARSLWNADLALYSYQVEAKPGDEVALEVRYRNWLFADSMVRAMRSPWMLRGMASRWAKLRKRS